MFLLYAPISNPYGLILGTKVSIFKGLGGVKFSPRGRYGKGVHSVALRRGACVSPLRTLGGRVSLSSSILGSQIHLLTLF